jgi:hypothetical protein
MEKQHWLVITVIILTTVIDSAFALRDVGYSIEKYDESPGLYYESKGIAVLYNMVWKTIVYVDLNKVDSESLTLRQYVHHVEMLCQTSVIRNWTGCAHFSEDSRDKLNQLSKTEMLLREITGQRVGGNRRKRGVSNLIGELSKILFGTMDDDDAKYYNEQIKLFEQNSGDMTALMKQQLLVVKSSLGAINNTLTDVAYNEKLLKDGIHKVTDYLNTLKSESDAKMNLVSAKIEVEGHILRVNSAISTLQRKLDLLINSVVNAHKGILQPQVISPVTLMESLQRHVPAFPKDTTLPFPLSKDSAHQLTRICEMQVYIKNGILGYVILLPLVNQGNFNIYKLIPIPVPLDRSTFLYIDTGKSFLWIDQARQYYFLSDKEELEECKMMNIMLYVCKQNQPLLSSHLHENCLVKMLQLRGNVPTICEKRVVELSNSVWTQLENNEWIYFVPASESITILCAEKPPIDIIVTGIGKLGIKENCKGFGRSAHFQTHSILNVDNPGYESDFLSTVNLEYDCCEYLNSKTNFSSLRLNASFKHIVSHLDDLKVASHRISEVEHMIKEQEWRKLHTASHNTYSVLVYVCFVAIGLYLLYKLYNCIKNKVNCIKTITDTTGSGNAVNIKIHTSNESIALSQEEVPLRELTSSSPEAKPRRSGRLRTSKTCF